VVEEVGHAAMRREGESGGFAFRFDRCRSEHVRAKVVSADDAGALFVELSHEGTVKARLRAESFAEVADRRTATLGVSGLIDGCKSREIGSQSFHAARLPFGNSKSIPFGTLPSGNGH